MIVFAVIVGITFYVVIAGIAFALFKWKFPWRQYDGDGYIAASIVWPIGLPAIGSYNLAKHIFRKVDEKHAAKAKERAELERRLKELEAELWEVKGKKL
jgi:hypothetical protein